MLGGAQRCGDPSQPPHVCFGGHRFRPTTGPRGTSRTLSFAGQSLHLGDFQATSWGVSWRRVACRQDSDRQEERGRTGQGLEVGRRTTHSVTNQPAWTGLQAFSQGMTLKCSGHCQEVCASGGGGEAGATCQKAQSDHAYRQASVYRTKGKPSGGAGCRGFPSTVQTTRRIEPGKGPCPHPQVPPVSPSPPLRQEGLSHI